MPKAIDYEAKCRAPAKEFMAFAKRLASPRGRASLEALASSTAAELFAQRLVNEALSGEPRHAAPCLGLVAQFAQRNSWAKRFQSIDSSGQPLRAVQLRVPNLEPAVQGLEVIFPADVALRWIALAYLTGKVTQEDRAAIQNQLITKATTSKSLLLEALSSALQALPSDPQIPASVASRGIEAISRFAAQRSPDAHRQATDSPLLRLATRAPRDHVTELVAALLSLQSAPMEMSTDADAQSPDPAPSQLEDAIAQAAWMQADDALARALQNTAALKHALDNAGEVHPAVKGYARVVTQAVHSAAAQRELELEDVIGATTPYNPGAHTSDEPITGADALVRIQKPAVAQGKKAYRHILRKAEVVPV